jgi:hypothetical protein
MPLLKSDHELLSTNIEVCRARLEIARKLLKRCPDLADAEWATEEITEIIHQSIDHLKFTVDACQMRIN